ncbi:MAG: ABC transporter ATP-binding protein [Planctomycetota bacterium]
MNDPSKASHLPFEVEDVEKTFPQGRQPVQALRGVSLTAEPGEFLVIMGASGSGKSTLLHAMAGLTDVDSGVVRVTGQDLSDLSDARLTRFRQERIGLVFQAFNLIPTLTARDNVRLPVLADRTLAENADQLLADFGLSERGHHKPDELSGGEQQRVAIARALISRPAILLLDEPTGSLDSVAGQELCRVLKRLTVSDQLTIVVVTHEPAVACWADRVVVLSDGRLVDQFAGDGIDQAESLARRYHTALEAGTPAERMGVQ